MICLLLPMSVLVDGDGGIAIPKNYDEYLQAMDTERFRVISFRPGFVWPTEEVALNFTGEKQISFEANMEIPANVTVNCSQKIVFSGNPDDIAIHGAWNCLSETGLICSLGGAAIYNGEVTFSGENGVSLGKEQFTFNGPLHLQAMLSGHDIVLGDGVVIDGEKTLRFSGALSVPHGTATIAVKLHPPIGQEDDMPTLQGAMTVQEILINSDTPCTVAEGSHVTAEKLNLHEDVALTVDGTLELPWDSRHNTMSGTIHLNDTGVLIVQPSVKLAQANWGQITGTGTLMINADVRENGKPYATPTLFGTNAMKGLPEGKIASTVTIVQNWE